MGGAVSDMEAMATVPGWGETTQGEVLAGWLVAIMATAEVSQEAIIEIWAFSAVVWDNQLMAMAVYFVE